MTDRLFSAYAASSELTGLNITSTNPGSAFSGSNSFNTVMRIIHSDDTSGLDTGFTNLNTFSIDVTAYNGLNANGGHTTAKTSYIPFAITANYYGSGQRFGGTGILNGYGFGDLAWESISLTYAGGCVNGDEGTGFSTVNYLQQMRVLAKTQIASIPTQATISTTTTQAITGSRTAQTVTVASTAGVTFNQWVVVEQEVQSGTPNLEAVLVTAVNTGVSITGIFRLNHPSGVTVTPAKVLVVNTSGNMGQDRLLVNLSGSSYSTGTVASIAGGAFTGSGTSWSNSMVGGTATNIGAIALTADDYTGTPFSSGAGTLKSWAPITVVTSTTVIGVFSFEVAGSTAYKGKGVASTGAYIIRPSARILQISGNTLILETSAHTWTAGDTVECAICPYPYVLGYQYHLANWTATGTNLVGFLKVVNNGARAYGTGIDINADTMAVGGGADTIGWTTGISLDQVGTGLRIIRATTAAIMLSSGPGTGSYTDIAGKISWNGTHIMPNSTNGGLELQMAFSSASGNLSCVSSNVSGEALSRFQFTGSMKWTGYADISEMTAPAAPASNIARLYSDDNGSGKTRLMVRFPTGAAVQLAIEP